MTTMLVIGPSMSWVRDRMLPVILDKIKGKLYTYTKSAGIRDMAAEIVCCDDHYIFHSFDQGKEKLQGLIFDKVMIEGEAPGDIHNEIISRIIKNNATVLNPHVHPTDNMEKN